MSSIRRSLFLQQQQDGNEHLTVTTILHVSQVVVIFPSISHLQLPRKTPKSLATSSAAPPHSGQRQRKDTRGSRALPCDTALCLDPCFEVYHTAEHQTHTAQHQTINADADGDVQYGNGEMGVTFCPLIFRLIFVVVVYRMDSFMMAAAQRVNILGCFSRKTCIWLI